MTSLWWLQPEWKDALCSKCGRNIWQSGGDPDWGLCYECFSKQIEENRLSEESKAQQYEEYTDAMLAEDHAEPPLRKCGMYSYVPWIGILVIVGLALLWASGG